MNSYRNYGDCCGNCIHVLTLNDGCLRCNHPDLKELSLKVKPKVDLIHVCNKYNDRGDSKVLIETENTEDFVEVEEDSGSNPECNRTDHECNCH